MHDFYSLQRCSEKQIQYDIKGYKHTVIPPFHIHSRDFHTNEPEVIIRTEGKFRQDRQFSHQLEEDSIIKKHQTCKRERIKVLDYCFSSCHDYNHPCIIKWWPTCPPTHLLYHGTIIFHIKTFFLVEVLC